MRMPPPPYSQYIVVWVPTVLNYSFSHDTPRTDCLQIMAMSRVHKEKSQTGLKGLDSSEKREEVLQNLASE